jgi:hypothetical protein
VSLISFHSPANVVHAVRHGHHGGTTRKDIGFQAIEAPLRCLSPSAGIDETHLSLRETKQRIVLDDLSVLPRCRDAIAKEDNRIPVLQGELRPEWCSDQACDT